MVIGLHTPNGDSIPVAVNGTRYGVTGFVEVRLTEQVYLLLSGEPEALAHKLRRIAAQVEGVTVAEAELREALHPCGGWEWLSPGQVVAYLEQSPVLRSCAAGVKALMKRE